MIQKNFLKMTEMMIMIKILKLLKDFGVRSINKS